MKTINLNKLNKKLRSGLAIFVLIFLTSVSAASAATRTVTKTADTNDGACDADCSLREAIAAASAGDTVAFASPTFDSPQIITLSDAAGFQELVINKSLTITGNGANLLTVRRLPAAANFRIFNIQSGTVNLTGMTITGGNTTSRGGGIFNSGTLTVIACHITGNTSANIGGGIRSENGTLTVLNSTVSNNTSNSGGGGNSGAGGGISSTDSMLVVTNSTITGNSAPGGSAGGIYTDSTTTITNSTITRNIGGAAGGVFRLGNLNNTTVRNSIIASNCAIVFNTTCGSGDPPDVAIGSNGTGSFVSGGYDIIGNRGSETAFNQTGDRTGTGAAPLDPQLFPLRDNGGATPTHALRSNSPAINPASSNGAPAADQRGAPRIGTADIGAFEFLDIVTNTNDSGAGSLRQVVADAPAGGSVIFGDFFRLEARTIDLSSGQITISKNLEIVGLGANVLTVRNTQAQNSTSRVFNIQSGIVRLSGMTVTGGNLSDIGNSRGGGGIFNNGSLTVFACHITGNTDNSNRGGGGILNDGAALTIINSTVSGNTATGGSNSSGGIFNQGNSTLNLLNSTVSGNRATGGNSNGGGILAVGDTVISSSTVTDNEINPSGSNSAGGILKFNGTIVTIRNSIVAGNCARTINPICSQSTTPDVSTFGNAFTSQGYNLIGNVGTAGGFNQTGDQTGTSAMPLNPQLAPLASNGGTTPTHALTASSPAIDKGNSFGTTTDQRGLTRPVDLPTFANANGGDAADIGAFELQSFATTAATVSIGGRVTNLAGGAIANVLISLTDGGGNVRTTISNSSGYYNFADISTGATYIVTAKGKRFAFAHPLQVVNVSDDATDVDFIGIPAARFNERLVQPE